MLIIKVINIRYFGLLLLFLLLLLSLFYFYFFYKCENLTINLTKQDLWPPGADVKFAALPR